jgi:hypothetical protein
VRYELGFYIPEDDNLYSHRCENLKSYNLLFGSLTDAVSAWSDYTVAAAGAGTQ